MGTILGSILDPAADKFLMTTMVVTLAMRDMLPCELFMSLGGSRRTDEWIQSAVGVRLTRVSGIQSLSQSSFWGAMSPCPSRRSTSATLPCRLQCVQHSSFKSRAGSTRESEESSPASPSRKQRQKTFKRYWDFSIPSASVHPTQISKYNTFLQLVLVGITTVAPLLPIDLSTPLLALQ